MNKRPVQLVLPCVERHEGDLDYYYERADRHRLQLERAIDRQNVYVYDLDMTTFKRPKIFCSKLKFSFKRGFYWKYDLATYIFWDSFLVSLFDQPLPLANEMKERLARGQKVGIYTARQYRWFSYLWCYLKIGKGLSFVKFRPKNDKTADVELKERYLKECLFEYDYFNSSHIVAYDDNEDILSMYRQNEIECYLP
jgi:hypothetical protein